MGEKSRHRYKKGGKPIYRQQRKRQRKLLNRGRGPQIGDIKNWI